MTADEAGYGSRPQDDPYEGRRQLDVLTAAELRANPAWWFPPPDGHLTGPDSSTVMPVEVDVSEGALEFPEGRYLLHAVFTLAEGTTLDGHVSYDPQDAGSLGEREPTVCTDDGQIPLWRGVLVPSAREIALAFAMFGKERDAVFPITWRSRLHPTSGPIEGRLEGFGIWKDGGERVV